MSFDFVDSSDKEIYARWHAPLLERPFGDTIDLHHDLYELTHMHRREHNCGEDDGPCSAWPSPPYLAPVWRMIADRVAATRFLEVGTGLGYTAALMADAGGPRSRVDTIEIDPDHADLAEAELGKRGLSGKIRIIRGDAKDILQSLDEPYDVVFSDGGAKTGISRELRRLTQRAGAGAGIKSRLREPLLGVLADLRAALSNREEREADALSRARAAYQVAVGVILSLESRK
jgi:SAM-dependent methyltransferase